MSERFPGGVISKTAPVPTGPYENGTAPGIWTLEQQAEFVRQGIWPIAGNVPNYIEDVFSTWLYTGNGWYNGIYNGINLVNGLNLIPGQSLLGGFFAGFISTSANGVATHALIVAPRSGGQSPSNLAFGASGISTGLTSVINGPANSAALASTYSSPAALFCENLTLNGYSDWYLPARFELEIAYPVFKPSTDLNNTSSGTNAYSVPVRTATYTSTAPAQTTITSFIDGASNYFDTNEYWTSTESNSSEARWVGFRFGDQNDGGKNSTKAVRAFRRVAVSDAALDPYRITGKGGLVWVKKRSGTQFNVLQDTVRGAGQLLYSNTTDAQGLDSGSATNFASNGFVTGFDNNVNEASSTYASWTFREQSKFFDIVTYTGNEVSGRQISHNLGSVPGCIIVKAIDRVDNWAVYHRSQGATKFGNLQNTDPFNTSSAYWNNTEPTSTVFTIGNQGAVNNNGTQYVAYLFAHNAGGFGTSGNDNVISCGSYVGTGNNQPRPTIDLGYEPQFVMIKAAANVRTDTSAYNNWAMVDVMRGMPNPNTSVGYALAANLSTAENGGFLAANSTVFPTATGFQINSGESMYNFNGCTYIYIAIRRGPMAVPTTGTSVFSANFGNNLTGAGTIINSSMLVDMFIQKGVASGSETPTFVHDRLRGAPQYLQASGTNEELTAADWRLSQNTGVGYSTSRNLTSRIGWMFRRAPQFFDEVCYTGNDVARNLTHNLGAVPELWIVKIRSASGYSWAVGGGVLGSATNNFIILNSTSGSSTLANFWATPTTTTFGFGSGAPSDTSINQSGQTYVSYLFASCPGVSKVGSYTGTGATQVINCGFAAGARFVMIKATSTTGDWYVWDSTRGIVAGNDPYLEMNTADPEVTGTDWVDTAATGFELSNAGGNLANSNGVSYIFLAIS